MLFYPVTIPIACLLVYGSEFFIEPKEIPVQKSVMELREERLKANGSIATAVEAELNKVENTEQIP